MKTIKTTILLITALMSISACNSDSIECEITPKQSTTCSNGLIIMQMEDLANGLVSMRLDSLQIPTSQPLDFKSIRIDQDQDYPKETRPSNYDAYDPKTNTYVIEFPVQQRLFVYDINTQSRSEYIVSGFYSAPVFDNGKLYTVGLDNFGNASDPADYKIQTIDLSSGSVQTLHSGSFPLKSFFNWETMSSANDRNGQIYFLSGSNLLMYNVNSNTSSHTELAPNFATNNETFYGLEIRNDGKFLTIRRKDGQYQMVSFDPNNYPSSITVLFDFNTNNIMFNPEFYSSTYDACQDKYYLTTRGTPNFFEFDLKNKTVKNNTTNSYLLGVETKK